MVFPDEKIYYLFRELRQKTRQTVSERVSGILWFLNFVENSRLFTYIGVTRLQWDSVLLRNFLGTLSNPTHDTHRSARLNAIPFFQKGVFFSVTLALLLLGKERLSNSDRSCVLNSVLACTSYSHRHALGNILCSLNPFLNHLSEVFLCKGLRGTLGQFKA
jgi:hypothetical protein